MYDLPKSAATSKRGKPRLNSRGFPLFPGADTLAFQEVLKKIPISHPLYREKVGTWDEVDYNTVDKVARIDYTFSLGGR